MVTENWCWCWAIRIFFLFLAPQSYYDNRMSAAAQLLDIIADLAKAHLEDEKEDPTNTKAFLKQVSISSSYDETCHLFCVRWSLSDWQLRLWYENHLHCLISLLVFGSTFEDEPNEPIHAMMATYLWRSSYISMLQSETSMISTSFIFSIHTIFEISHSFRVALFVKV